MSRRAHLMTHADRANRRAAVLHALRHGALPPEVAERFGISRPWVCQIAKRAGLEIRGRGAPRAQLRWRECPDHLRPDYHFLIYKKHYSAAQARAVLERLV